MVGVTPIYLLIYSLSAHIANNEETATGLRPWHYVIWLVLATGFTPWAIYSDLNFPYRHNRSIPAERLMWNAITANTGPFAGIMYWDYGHHKVNNVLNYAAKKRLRRGEQQVCVLICVAMMSTAIVLSLGVVPRRNVGWVHYSVNVYFILASVVWYLASVFSKALLA